MQDIDSESAKFGSPSLKFDAPSPEFGAQSLKFDSQSLKIGSPRLKIGSPSPEFDVPGRKFESLFLKDSPLKYPIGFFYLPNLYENFRRKILLAPSVKRSFILFENSKLPSLIE